MPDRIIRAAIITSDRVNTLSWGAETFYRRLMSVVDDFGRFDGRPSILRAQLYPLKLDKVSEPDIGKWIRECDDAALVRCYSVDSKQYLELLRFGQRMRAEHSKWPPPPSADSGCPQPADIGGQRRPYSEAETNTETTSAEVAKPTPRAKRPLFDSLAIACGLNLAQMTKRQAAACGTALAEIQAVCPELTPAEIQRRAEAYGRKYRQAALTPSALCSHWGEFVPPPPDRRFDPILEPENWRKRIESSYPTATILSDDRRWSELPRGIQMSLIEALQDAEKAHA